MTATNVFTRASEFESGVLMLEQLAHVIDGRGVLLGKSFDDLLVAGRIAGAVPQKGHCFSSSLGSAELLGDSLFSEPRRAS